MCKALAGVVHLEQVGRGAGTQASEGPAEDGGACPWPPKRPFPETCLPAGAGTGPIRRVGSRRTLVASSHMGSPLPTGVPLSSSRKESRDKWWRDPKSHCWAHSQNNGLEYFLKWKLLPFFISLLWVFSPKRLCCLFWVYSATWVTGLTLGGGGGRKAFFHLGCHSHHPGDHKPRLACLVGKKVWINGKLV